MPRPPDPSARAEAELLILRALCQDRPPSPLRQAARRILLDYQWREPVHHAVFGCLLQFSTADPQFLRSELPSCLTRRGFPDIDWAAFFKPLSSTPRDIQSVMLGLADADRTAGPGPSPK